MKLVKSIYLLAILLGFICLSCEKRSNSSDIKYRGDSIKLSEIKSYAKSHYFDSSKYSKIKSYDYFDFSQFKPGNLNDNNYEVSVYYDSDNEIVKIFRQSALLDNDYEFRVIHNKNINYHLLFPREFYDDSSYEAQYLSGYFLLYNGACYYLSASDPFVIMQLDKNLNVIKTIVFRSDYLAYKTIVNYRDSSHLYSETFLKSNEKILLSKEILLSDITNLFDDSKNFSLDKEMTLGLVPELDHLPLWRFEGRQEYDEIVKP